MPENPCDHDQLIASAGKSHQKEACLFVAFGWVNATGNVDVQAMMDDFTGGKPNPALKSAMTDEKTGFKACIGKAVEAEKE